MNLNDKRGHVKSIFFNKRKIQKIKFSSLTYEYKMMAHERKDMKKKVILRAIKKS
jgi:hypothetical protein